MGKARPTLEEYLAMEYPFNVIADPDGGYVVKFPDLPGCLTQVEDLDEIGPMVKDAFRAWMEAAYEGDLEIPLPSQPPQYSGSVRLRVPSALHQELAEQAAEEGVSLNSWMVTLLAQGNAEARAKRRTHKSRAVPRDNQQRRDAGWSAPPTGSSIWAVDEESKAA